MRMVFTSLQGQSTPSWQGENCQALVSQFTGVLSWLQLTESQANKFFQIFKFHLNKIFKFQVPCVKFLVSCVKFNFDVSNSCLIWIRLRRATSRRFKPYGREPWKSKSNMATIYNIETCIFVWKLSDSEIFSASLNITSVKWVECERKTLYYQIRQHFYILTPYQY